MSVPTLRASAAAGSRRAVPPRMRMASTLLAGIACMMVPGSTGCSDKGQVIEQARRTGIRRAYENSTAVDQTTDEAFERLICAIQRTGGSVIVADRQAGIVSWIDTGYAFHVPAPLGTRSGSAVPFGDVSLSTWHGFVHASARIQRTDGASDILIKAICRDETDNHVHCSDGSFERLLLRECRRAPEPRLLARSDPSASFPRLGGSAGGSTQPALKGGVDYWHLYYGQFKQLPPVSSREVSARGFHQVIPAPPGKVWQACLDLMWQYDGIAYLSNSDRVAVFARSLATVLPAKPDKAPETRFVDVVMAIAVQEAPGGGTRIAVSWLDPRAMQWAEPPLQARQAEGNTPSTGPLDKPGGAVVLTGQLIGELAMQLFWWDRLLSKFKSPS